MVWPTRRRPQFTPGLMSITCFWLIFQPCARRSVTIRESVMSWVCGKTQKAMAKMRKNRAQKIANKKTPVGKAKAVKTEAKE